MNDHSFQQIAESSAVKLAEDAVLLPAARSTLPLALAGACAFINVFATQPVLPLLSQTFHASKFAVSLTMTIPPLAIAAAAPVVGRLSDRWGRKRTMIWAAFLLSISTILAATSSALSQIIFWRFMQGIFTPGVFSVAVAYINEEWDQGHAGHAMAIYGTGSYLGGCLGRILMGIIAGHFQWRWSFIALGCINLLMALALAKTLPRESRFAASRSTSSLHLMCSHLRNRPLLATYFAGVCIFYTMFAVFNYINFHLSAAPYSLSTTALGYIFLVYLLGIITTPIAGHWIDRFGHRHILVWGTIIGIAGALLTLARPLWVIIVGLAVFNASTCITQSTTNSHIGRVVTHSHALAAGLYASFYYLGGAAGSSTPAWLWNFGRWPGCVILVVLVQAISIAIALYCWPGKEQPRKTAEAVI